MTFRLLFPPQVDRAEFLQYMLVNMNKAQEDDIAMINALFDSLDADGSGVLDINDIPEGGVDVTHMSSPQAEQQLNSPSYR